jgi:Putative DNA-binding domain
VPHSAPAELARLQRGFLALATARSGRTHDMRAALTEIDAADASQAREQIGVYRRMYALRMVREVAREFPATRALLGARTFTHIANAFVAAHASHSFTLEGYADALPEFVRRSATLRTASARRRAGGIAALERSLWRNTRVRVRVASNETALLQALLSGAGLEQAVAVATRSGLAPDAIRGAFEHWVAAGLLELGYRSDPASIQVARCGTSARA